MRCLSTEKADLWKDFFCVIFLNSYSAIDIHLAFALTGHLRKLTLTQVGQYLLGMILGNTMKTHEITNRDIAMLTAEVGNIQQFLSSLLRRRTYLPGVTTAVASIIDEKLLIKLMGGSSPRSPQFLPHLPESDRPHGTPYDIRFHQHPYGLLISI